jgi:small conductance mechanosensitive channel
MDPKLSDIEAVYSKLQNMALTYGLQFIVALLLLAAGLFFGGKLSKIAEKFLLTKNVDQTLAKFLANLLKGAFAILVAVVVLNQMGFAITPLVAALGALAFGASFAIQGLLSNFGAGLAIIIMRPFKLGDTIQTQNCYGQVFEIKLMQTLLRGEDGEVISVPNHMILGQVLVNSDAARLADDTVGVAYGTDIDLVKKLICDILDKDPDVLSESKVHVGLDGFGDSALLIRLRYQVPTHQFFDTRFRVLEAINKTLIQHNIEIPFPHRVVSHKSNNSSALREPQGPF